jgi:hypothetical protein
MSRPVKSAEGLAPEQERPARSAGASHCYHTTIRIHGAHVELPFGTRTRTGLVETFGGATDVGLFYINGAARPVRRLSDRLWETAVASAGEDSSLTLLPPREGSGEAAQEPAPRSEEDGRLIIVDPRDYPRRRANYCIWPRSASLPKTGEPRWLLERDKVGVETLLWLRPEHTLYLSLYATFWDGQAVPFGRQLGEFLCTLLSRLVPQLDDEAAAARLAAALDGLLQQADAQSPAPPAAETA